MRTISRRKLFKKTAAGATLAGVLSAGVRGLGATPLGMPIGCQTYLVRAAIGQDFTATIKQLADAGF